MTVFEGGLWASAFARRKNDPHADARERLRQSLLRMRENVGSLISTIPSDCKALTVHDLSHLDALWEMASIVAGHDYPINPAEAFVLGGAILLHDSGMSVAAYPGGLAELTATPVWRDIAASTMRQNGIDPSTEDLASPPAALMERIKFDVLRTLHAEQAEQMATARWDVPNGDALYLLENQEFRQSFGGSIGRIAHSHHWDLGRVSDALASNVGTSPSLPAEWTVNEKVVACLLRCADIAHMDQRRAPAMLYAALKPDGVSAQHWAAQTRINKPAVDAGSLVYTSGSPYSAADADAWWLAYDMIRWADAEIRTSNGLLEEIGANPLAVRRVRGAESPGSLSKHLKTDGWKPIDAEVKVSDPVHLARTLGGSRLYGHDPLAPVRELLQNATDAVRARRELQSRLASHGQIRITIEQAPEADACWLHIDDNGIGMTERVLSGPLIDFGKSIWNSSLLREEFPGLQSKNISPIGKFGIGFFAVFELAKHVIVISRKHDAAASDAKALEFRSISTRPLVRDANTGELPQDFSTRVSILVENKKRITDVYGRRPAYNPENDVEYSFASAVKKLVSMVDINIEYNDIISGHQFVHTYDVYGKSGADLINDLMPSVPERRKAVIREVHGSMLSEMVSKGGQRLGRAAMYLLEETGSHRSLLDTGGVSVGGFVYGRGQGLPVPYVGVIEGKTDQASRSYASANLDAETISAWATDQASRIDQARFLKSQLMNAAEKVITLGGDPGRLPYCFAGGALIDYASFREKVGLLSTVLMPMSLEYSSSFKLLGYGDIGANYFDLPLTDGVIVPRRNEDRLIDEELARMITKQGREDISLSDLDGGSQTLKLLMRTIQEVWGVEPKPRVYWTQLFRADVYSPPSTRWVLAFNRPQNAAI